MSRLLALVLALAMLAPLPAAANGFYLCTGLGRDAREEAKNFRHTMHLVFAEKSGGFLGEVSVLIESNGETVIEQGCDGPWFMANLVPGTYHVTATFNGTSKTATLTLGTKKLKHVFRF